jgi:Domain of unknown function (DUF4397)
VSRLSVGVCFFSISLLAVVALVSSGCGGGSNAQLRVMNASPDESSLTALVNSNNFASGISYGTASGYQALAAGSQHLQIEPTSTSTIVIDQNISVNSGTYYTVIATGFLSSITGLSFVDDHSSPSSGNIKIRIINASPSLGSADVYIVAPGTELASATPSVSALAYQSASSYQSLTAGNYEVFFTAAGQKFAFIDSGQLTLNTGQVRTVVGLNSPTGGFTSAALPDLN